MKILILTVSHIWYDSRLYFRIAQSLLKREADIHLLTGISDGSSEQNDRIRNFTYECLGLKNNKLSLINTFIKKGLKYKPDIILCIEPITLIAGLALKKSLKCRVVYDAHEYYAEAFAEKHKGLYKQYLFLEKKLATKMDAVIAVNDILLERFKPNSYLCANFPKRDSFIDNINTNKKYDAIYAGGLWFERGLKVYLEVANFFKINNKNFKLLIIGSFKNKAIELYFHNYIKTKKLEDYIIYKPYMPQSEVLQEMSSAKVGLFFGDIENSPRYDKSISMKVLEYFSQKIPVIINKLDVLGDFVEKSKGGWIVEYDSLSLYILLSDILEDKRLLSNKGNYGYNYVYLNALWENQEEELFKAVFGNINE